MWTETEAGPDSGAPEGVQVVEVDPLTIELTHVTDRRRFRRMRWIGYGLFGLSGLILIVLLMIAAGLVPSPGFYVTSSLKYAGPFLVTVGTTALAFEILFRKSKASVQLDEGALVLSVINMRMRIPVGDIHGIAIEIEELRRARFDATAPLPSDIPSNASAALLVRVPDGWVRLLTSFDVVQLMWLVGRLGREFAIRPLASPSERQKIQPVAELGQLTRPLWWTCVFVLPLVGGMAGWVTWSELRLGVISRGWPMVQAVVLESDYEVDRQRRSRGRERVSHDANFRYRYEVNGNSFESDRISYELGSDTPIVRRLIEEHQVGSHVSVHYDPSNPERATALTGVDPRLVGLVLIGATLFVAGMAWLPFAYPRAGRVRLQRAYFDRARRLKIGFGETPRDGDS